MRTSGASSSSSSSSRRQEETIRFKEEEGNDASPMRNRQEASSQDTDQQQQQQAELFRKLDSLKGHVLRGQDSPRASHHRRQPPPPIPMGFHGPPPPPPYGIMYHHPYGFPMHQSLYQGAGHHYPNQMMPHQGQYVDIGPDIIDPQQQLHDPRFFPSRYPVSHHTRWPSDINSEMMSCDAHTRWPSETGSGAFARGYVQTAAAAAAADSSLRRRRRFHPLAGGAPFVACLNCFELLYLPRKKLLHSQQEKQQQHEKQLQCGGCSELFCFTIVHNKLVLISSSSDDDDCPLKDDEPKTVQASEGGGGGGRSSNIPHKEEVLKSVRRRGKDATKAPPPENSNLLELFEYSNVNRATAAAALSLTTYGMSQLGYNKQVSFTTKQDETDISYTEEEEDSRIDYYTKSKSKSKSNDDDRDRDRDRELEVWVNGHLIPEDEVISAEKQAGPVQAGNYWYDYRAGFWGVMGNPCLGIIPPFIEEFSRPMPDNCGAGNTRVFVNGRELHERDLELLSSRGLPRGNNRSYIVDISGRVLDGDSGEELKSLGKLAPTIEKVKHGFGMRVPRYLASST